MEGKYKNLVSDPREPFALFAIETGKGWRPIAERVLDEIVKYNESSTDGSHIYVDQVKEKFGGLEIYVTYEDVPDDVAKHFDDVIENARQEAAVTCEFCGTKENVGTRLNGWYSIMCENCAREIVKDHTEKGLFYKNGIKWKRASDGKGFLITEKETKEL